MLRRKLLINLGPLVGLLLGTAWVAIWLLQGILRDLNQTGPSASDAVIVRFRMLVLALAVVFLVVINVSVVVLVRMGSMVVKPVDKLLGATRELAAGHFDYRVKLDQKDEFGELAQAYNSMAQQLQTNEQNRMETLLQAAVTMNHELNNAMATIDMQLALLGRQTPNPASERYLRQIQQSLHQMTHTVQSLKNIRRIVLTDYAPGTKMLDLQRSTEQEQTSGPESHQ